MFSIRCVQLQPQAHQHAAWCTGSCGQNCNKVGSVNADLCAAAASLHIDTEKDPGAARRQRELRKRCVILMLVSVHVTNLPSCVYMQSEKQ